MLIQVMYTDGRFEMVTPNILDDLLEQQEITCFMRSKVWALVGRDPIRTGKSKHYRGKERRAS